MERVPGKPRERMARRPDQDDVGEVDFRLELGRHHTASFAWALRCSRGDREEAIELLHTTYLKVLDGQAVFAGRSGFKTWLFAVIRNTARERRRRKVLERLGLVRAMRLAAAERELQGPGKEGGIEEPEARALRAAIERLPRRQGEIIELVFYHGLSIADAAGVMGVGIGTARTHYERAKANLSKQIGSEPRQ